MKLYKVTNTHYRSVYTTGTYKYTYKIGSIVIAKPRTLGLMLFDHISRARSFRCNYDRILIVDTLDVVTKPSKVCGNFNLMDFYHHFYKGDRGILLVDPPVGTVCCQSVRVIGEIT